MSNKIVKMTSRQEIDDELKVMAYITGQLPENEVRQFEEELLSNPQLKLRLHEELALKNRLQELRSPELGSELNFSAFEKQLDRPFHKLLGRIKLPLAAVATLFIVSGISYFSLALIQENRIQEFEALTTSSVSDFRNGQDYNLIFKSRITLEQQVDFLNEFNLIVEEKKEIPDLGVTRLRLTSENPLSDITIRSIQERSEIMFFEIAVNNNNSLEKP